MKVIYLCDVKSCRCLAQNEILLRRGKLRLCHAHNFVSVRSPEYRKWKALQQLYKLPVEFSDHIRHPHLKIIKTFWSRSLTVL